MSARTPHSPTLALLLSALLCAAGCVDGSLQTKALDDSGEPVVDENGNPVPVTPPRVTPDMGGGGGGNNTTTPPTPGEPIIVPGRVTIRRLNRAEYDNTVRDLLLTEQRPAEAFPADDFGFGFNNIGDTLTISPLHVELYEKSAEALLEEALQPAIASRKESFEAEAVEGSVGAAAGDFWNLWSNGEVVKRLAFPAAGTYRITVRAGASQAGDELAKMAIILDSKSLKQVDVDATRAEPKTYSVEFTVDSAGERLVGASFLNDFNDSANNADRNLYVDWVELEGPIGATAEESPARRRIMICQEQDVACARQIFGAFAKRAWRRPVTEAELDRLAQFMAVAATHQLGFEDGIRLGLKAVLLSPHFIFRPELDRGAIGEPHALSAHELAARLSYFLWSSTPDDTLLTLADSGQLLEESVLRAQVTRMLEDERAQALIDNFATQWLYLDAVLEVQPDYQMFPEFDEALQRSMRLESRRFASDFLLQDTDFRQLLLADYSYINARLATHYGIEGVSGEELQRHTFEGEERRGFLTHGSLLTARSYPNRTSPVLRGVWVLEHLLCSEPPPPPAGVESIDAQTDVENLTLRERLALHSSKPACAGCHKTMDPIGFGLEHYDATGHWREQDNGKMVDAEGKFPDGRTFLGAHQMAEILANDPLYAECLSEQLLTYATGRGYDVRSPGQSAATGVDAPQIAKLAAQLEQSDYSSRELITQVVLSDAFRKRTPEPRQ